VHSATHNYFKENGKGLSRSVMPIEGARYLMTRKLVTDAEIGVREAMRMIFRKNVKKLPIIEMGKLVS
jgi:predicted transcriptional regulator